MIILDFHGVFINPVHTILKKPEDLTLKNVRSCIFAGILDHRKKHYAKYGEIVLAMDKTKSPYNYWRRDYFKEYKASRSAARAKSSFDWSLFFDYFDIVKQELRENFPYKILEVPGAEADELIYLELVNRPDDEPSIIISADKDLKQCQRLNNVRQWSYITNKYLDEKHPLEYILEHTIRGDSGDGVPNVLSPNDVFINPDIRQKAIKSKDIERWKTMPLDTIHDELAEKLVIKPTKTKPEELTFDEAKKIVVRNWNRNTQMVDLSKTPQKYVDLHLEGPEPLDRDISKNMLYSYFAKNGLTNFINEVSNFIADGTKVKMTFAELVAAKKARL